ncbi:MAG: hypothetical protein V1855_02270, partial [bacterium]
LLVTTNEHAVLKTIVSRCQCVRLQIDKQVVPDHPLLDFFLDTRKHHDPFIFMQTLSQHKLSDSQSIHLIDQLLLYYSRKAIECSSQDNNYVRYQHAIQIIKKHMRKPPQSGSSDLFWKNLYLQFPHT